MKSPLKSPSTYEHHTFQQQISQRRRSKSNATALNEISWYHGDMARTATEILLLSEDILEGTYLLRKSRRHDGFTVSVKCKGSVKHFVLSYNDQAHLYSFGNASFCSLLELLDHFESCPILTRENDIPVTLVHPLQNNAEDDEPDDYVIPEGHAIAGKDTFQRQKLKQHCGSRSGYLFKRGLIRTNWKKRWFTVEKKSLKYFENRRTSSAIRDLDISMATSVSEVCIDDKKYSFQLVFPQRTFYFFGSTPTDTKEWIDFFQWKIDYYNKNDDN